MTVSGTIANRTKPGLPRAITNVNSPRISPLEPPECAASMRSVTTCVRRDICTITFGCGWPPTWCTRVGYGGRRVRNGSCSILLDGDPAANNLSWQWIGSTFSRKPYIFNRENLQRLTNDKYCSDCPLLGHCAFEGSYAEVSATVVSQTASISDE